MIKAIIFDIGGVITQDIWEHLLLSEDGIASTWNLDRIKVQEIGKELWERFAYLSADVKSSNDLEMEYWRLFNERMHVSIPINSLIKISNKFIKPIYGMIPLIKRLHSQGLELAICSNNTEFWFKREADKLNLHRFFEPKKIILSCHVGVPKKSDDFRMFDALIKSLESNKTECIFIDDREENIEKALRFGITGIYFPSHNKIGYKYLNKLLKNMGIPV